MKTRPIACALLLAFAPALAPCAAYAQTDDAVTQEVRSRFREGVDLFDQGHFEAARAKFKQAYALKPLPDILYNLAWSSLKSNHPVDGEREFTKYLREAKDIDPQQKDEAMKGLADAKSKNGHIEVAAPPGGDVYVDGERVGTSPIADAVPVEPGAHVVKYEPNDAAPQSQSVSVLAGQMQVARFGGATAVPTTAPPASPTPEPTSPPPSGTETPDTSTPPDTSATSAPPQTPPPGGETVESSHKSIFAPPANMTPVYVGGAITVIAGVTAIVMLEVKNNALDNFNSVEEQIKSHGGVSGTCTNPTSMFAKACGTLQSDENAVNSDATAGNIALAVTLVGLVGTAIYYFAASKDEPGTATQASSRGWVAPLLAAHTGGMALGGSF